MDELRKRLAVILMQSRAISSSYAGNDKINSMLFGISLAKSFAQTLGLWVASTKRIRIDIAAILFIKALRIAAVLSINFHG